MSDPDRDARAGEYVLGTLTAHESAAVERDMATDPDLALAVAVWERELASLSSLAWPEAPPPELWARIERQIMPEVPQPRATLSWRNRLLGGWALGATAIAAALGTFILLQDPPAAPIMTVLLADRTQPAWTAAFDRDGQLRLAAITSTDGSTVPPTPGDRVQQLWVLPPGETAPTSLGLLPRDQRVVTVQAPAIRPVPGMLIEITLEPPGGSTIGRPTGPVLFIGRLSQPGPPS
ncbi:MAG: anti-sigma factor [Gemmatimonadaceae bacterium]|nr:anti-sigma factor [Acetobacteraceae bacterium]